MEPVLFTKFTAASGANAHACASCHESSRKHQAESPRTTSDQYDLFRNDK